MIRISGLELEDSCSYSAKHRSLGLHVFAEKYWPLVRKLWVLTGYGEFHVGGRIWTQGDDGTPLAEAWGPVPHHVGAHASERGSKKEIDMKIEEEKAAALELVRWVFKEDLYGIGVNATKKAIVSIPTGEVDLGQMTRITRQQMPTYWRYWAKKDWPASLSFLWTLVRTEGELGTEPCRELRRVVWQ